MYRAGLQYYCTGGSCRRGSVLCDDVGHVELFNVIAASNEILSPLIESIVANALQGQTLTELRDTLIPRLISGQLSVNEVELESITA